MEIEQKAHIAVMLADYLTILENISSSGMAEVNLSFKDHMQDFNFPIENEALKDKLREFLKLELTNRIKELEANYFLVKEKE